MSEEQYEKFKKYISEYLVGEEQQIQILWTGIQAAKLSNTVPAFLLRGPPGAGKTFITKLIANYFNAEYVFLQATLNVSEDEFIYKYIPSEQTKSGIKILNGPLPEALERSKEKITILTIDEFDKTRPSADALLLDFLQNARVTFRIDENEKVIEGNKQNLIVFLTSNDNRDFSEPLLRRVIVINFQPPSPKAVETILEKEFKDKKLIKLLTTIYTAGLNAGLNKPVTIQELLQFGKALELMPNGNFNELLYSFVIKNIEDMQKLNEALHSTQNQMQESVPDVAGALVQHQEQEPQEEQEEKQEQHSVQEILTKIKVPEKEDIHAEKVSDEEERTFNTTISKDFNEYSNIIKTFKPTPNERPDVIGKFQIVLDETELKLTASTPLTLEEVQKLAESTMTFEAYTEDELYFQDYNEIIDIAKNNNLNFTYYAKNLIILKNDRVILRFELVKQKFFNLKMYINTKNGEDKKLVNHLLTYQQNAVLKNLLHDLQWKINEIQNGKFFNSNEYMQLKEFLEVTEIDAKVEIEADPHLYIAVTKGTPDAHYNIETEISNSTMKIILKRLDVTTQTGANSSDIMNIINKYSGTYNMLEGLLALKRMSEEIKNFIGDQQ